MAEAKDVLPYGTYGMLKNTVERFMESTVPTTLNRHVLDDLSGGDFSALMTALRYLGLVENNSVKAEFRALVQARKKSEADYKVALLESVNKAYAGVIGKIDVTAGTLPEIEKAFREASGYSGQMLTKAIRFYIKALEDANVEVSEHITKPRPRSTKGKNAKTQKKTKETEGAGNGKSESATEQTGERRDSMPQGFERLVMPGMKDAFIQYPSKLTKRDYDLLKAMLTVLGTYISLDENEEGKKP